MIQNYASRMKTVEEWKKLKEGWLKCLEGENTSKEESEIFEDQLHINGHIYIYINGHIKKKQEDALWSLKGNTKQNEIWKITEAQ